MSFCNTFPSRSSHVLAELLSSAIQSQNLGKLQREWLRAANTRSSLHWQISSRSRSNYMSKSFHIQQNLSQNPSVATNVRFSPLLITWRWFWFCFLPFVSVSVCLCVCVRVFSRFFALYRFLASLKLQRSACWTERKLKTKTACSVHKSTNTHARTNTPELCCHSIP